MLARTPRAIDEPISPRPMIVTRAKKRSIRRPPAPSTRRRRRASPSSVPIVILQRVRQPLPGQPADDIARLHQPEIRGLRAQRAPSNSHQHEIGLGRHHAQARHCPAPRPGPSNHVAPGRRYASRVASTKPTVAQRRDRRRLARGRDVERRTDAVHRVDRPRRDHSPTRSARRQGRGSWKRCGSPARCSASSREARGRHRPRPRPDIRHRPDRAPAGCRRRSPACSRAISVCRCDRCRSDYWGSRRTRHASGRSHSRGSRRHRLRNRYRAPPRGPHRPAAPRSRTPKSRSGHARSRRPSPANAPAAMMQDLVRSGAVDDRAPHQGRRSPQSPRAGPRRTGIRIAFERAIRRLERRAGSRRGAERVLVRRQLDDRCGRHRWLIGRGHRARCP